MKINQKVKIYERKFGKKHFKGIGTYKGTMKVYIPFSEGLRLLTLKYFQFKKGIILEDDCEYEIK